MHPFLAATSLLWFAFALALLWIGPPLTVLAPWDVIIHLDGTWRIYQGQIPHQDFHNPIGVFTYYLSALGMHLVGPSLYAVTVGSVIFVTLAAALATVCAYRRLAPPYAFAFTLFIILLASAMSQIGRPADLPGYVEIYNRCAWTLTCVFFLQIFVPLRANVAPRPILEGVLAGVTLAIIVFTKATFGFVSAGALSVALLMSGQWRNRAYMLALIGSGLVSIMVMRLLTGVDLIAYATEVLNAGAAQSWERRRWGIKETLLGGLVSFALLALLWALVVVVPAWKQRLRWADALKITAVAGVIGACGLLIAIGNTGEGGEIPLFVALGIYLLEAARLATGVRACEPRDWQVIAGVAIVALGLAGPIMLRDAMSIRAAAASRDVRAALAPAEQLFDLPSMRDFVIPRDVEWVTEYWKSAQLPARINDGLALMRREVGPQSTILTLSFSNPFPFALGLPAPRGTPNWFDYGVSYSREAHPDAEDLFANVDYVAIPIIRDSDRYRGGRKTTEELQAIYGPYLVAHYKEIGRSTYWILLKRRGPRSNRTQVDE